MRSTTSSTVWKRTWRNWRRHTTTSLGLRTTWTCVGTTRHSSTGARRSSATSDTPPTTSRPPRPPKTFSEDDPFIELINLFIPHFFWFSAPPFIIWNEHIRLSSTLIKAAINYLLQKLSYRRYRTRCSNQELKIWLRAVFWQKIHNRLQPPSFIYKSKIQFK